MVITAMLRNLKEEASFLTLRQWHLFTKNIWELAISDAVMVATNILSLPLHKVFKDSQGWLRWNTGGMLVQSLFQAVWLVQWVR